MNWFTLVKLIFQIGGWLTRQLERRQWINEGQMQILQEIAEAENAKIKVAIAARQRAMSEPDSVRDIDPFNRDN